MTTREATIWLGRKQIELYRQAPEVYIRAFRHGAANRAIMRQFYSVLVLKGLIMPLEATDPEYKTELKALAIELSNKELNLAGCLNMAKMLHIISQYQP